MNWEDILKKIPESIDRLPDNFQRFVFWLSDFPLITWIASFSPVAFTFEVFDKATRSRAGAFAAQIAFFILMSVFPFLILMLQVLRAAPVSQESLLLVIDNMFPGYLITPLHSILQEVFSTSFGLVPVTIITMLWTTSKVMHAMVAGLDLICDRASSRHWIVVRAWSLLYTLLLVVVLLALAGSTFIWQPLQEYLLRNRPRGVSLSMYTNVVRMIYTFLVGTLALSVLYKILPRRNLRFIVQIPGAFVAVAAIYIFSAWISIYVSRFNGFSAYGSLTTLTLIMFWLYFSCYFIMLGAVVNEVMHLHRRERKEALAAKTAAAEAKALASGAQPQPSVVSGKKQPTPGHRPRKNSAHTKRTRARHQDTAASATRRPTPRSSNIQEPRSQTHRRTPREPGSHTTLTLILALVVAVAAFTGCRGRDAEVVDPEPELAEQREFYVATFYFNYEDVFVGSIRSALNQDLAAAGIPYQEFDASNDQTTQTMQIERAIQDGAGALVVNIVSSGNSEEADVICQMADQAGIPVIFFNRPVEQAGYEGIILDYYDNVAYVGSDAEESGHLQGQIIGEYLLEHYEECDLNGDGVISYASFKGQAGNVGATYRTKYSAEDASAMLVEAGYEPLMYFDETSVDNFQLDLTGSWSMSSAQEYMLTDLMHFNLENDNMIELVIANSDSMAQGAILALQTNGFNTGDESSITIPVFGVDASEVGRRLIEQGVMTGTVQQDPEGTAACICHLVENAQLGYSLTEDMGAWDWDEEHNLPNRFVLHYSRYNPYE